MMCLESQLFLVQRPRWLRGTGGETGPVFQKAGKREVLGTRLQKRVRIAIEVDQQWVGRR